MSRSVKTRIAVYIRIGGNGNHTTAFEIQKTHFAEMISKNPDWELAGFYADLGMDSRSQPNLQRLTADCRAGRIDLIITKSISRISRNLRILMEIVREFAYLKPPVGIYFEDTQINTSTKDGFLFLSIFEAMAIHENEEKQTTVPYAQLVKHLKVQQNLQKDVKKPKIEQGKIPLATVE